MVPSITIFVRHSQNCRYQGDEFWKKCRCRKHFRYSLNGYQYRQTASTRSWDQAERNKRILEAKLVAQMLGTPALSDEPKTVEYAIAAFLREKQGGRAANNTIGKYKLTLARLQQFCDRTDVYLITAVTLDRLSAWRAEWKAYYSSVWALRNEQSRVRAFFRYCHSAGLIRDNPAAKLSTITVSDDDYKVVPFTEKEYKHILKTIPQCEEITAANRRRLDKLAKVQRWAGLSLVDAVCLSRNELRREGKQYWIDTNRRKTGVHLRNLIPNWLGKELEALENGNGQYLFMSGEATPKSAAGIFDKLYRKVFKRAGIQDGHSHRFRHQFAVSLLGKGVDMRNVSRALGHCSISVTERYYASWDRQQQGNLDRDLAKAWAR